MEVSDIDYLEKPDIMNWSYLNIIIRKQLIIVLKYFKLKKYLVHDYKYMETEMRKQNIPNTSVTQTGFSEKGRVKERVSEKLALFNGEIYGLIPW